MVKLLMIKINDFQVCQIGLKMTGTNESQRVIRLFILSFRCQPHEMVKNTQKICSLKQFSDELFEFDYFVGLTLKGLKKIEWKV